MRWTKTSVSTVDWKMEPEVFQLFPQDLGVDQVPIMADRDGTVGILHDEGLGILDMALSGGRIAVVPDGAGPVEPLDNILLENVSDQTHLAVRDQHLAIRGDDTRGFLTTVL